MCVCVCLCVCVCVCVCVCLYIVQTIRRYHASSGSVVRRSQSAPVENEENYVIRQRRLVVCVATNDAGLGSYPSKGRQQRITAGGERE